jgi:hypothetical protein
MEIKQGCSAHTDCCERRPEPIVAESAGKNKGGARSISATTAVSEANANEAPVANRGGLWRAGAWKTRAGEVPWRWTKDDCSQVRQAC